MKFTEIDGLRYEVRCCDDCPFFNNGAGFEYLHTYQHPAWDRKEYMTISEFKTHEMCDKLCPLGNSKPGEGEVIDPPGSNEEKEIVIPEWVHIRLEKEALGCLIAFCIPRLMEDIAKLDPKEQAQIVKNLEEIRRIARMKPEDVDLAESFSYIMDSRCYTVAKESKERERVVIGEFGPGEREIVFPESFLGGPEVVVRIREALSSYGMVGVFIVSPQLAERHRD